MKEAEEEEASLLALRLVPAPSSGRELFRVASPATAGTAMLIIATVATAIVTTLGYAFVLFAGVVEQRRRRKRNQQEEGELF